MLSNFLVRRVCPHHKLVEVAESIYLTIYMTRTHTGNDRCSNFPAKTIPLCVKLKHLE